MSEVQELLKKIKRVDASTNRLTDGLITGNYQSVFRGRGIEFSEVREYVPGDDIRSIDWNVTARFNLPYVKEFVEERDLDVYILFDVSSSGDIGSERSKKELGYEISASILFSALRSNDNIGLCLFSDHIEKFIKPGKGKKFFLRLLRVLVYHEQESSKTDIENVLYHMHKILHKRSLIFIVSDFLSGDFEKPLRMLRKRHDVVLVKLCDTIDEQIPDVGYLMLEDAETGEQILINTSDLQFRREFERYNRDALENLQSILKRIDIDMIQISTSEQFHIPLRRFFKYRKRRMVM